MTERRYRVLLVASHPVQYVAPIFQLMARHPQLEIQVAYCSLQGAEPGLDPEFGVEVTWDIPLLEGYPWVQLPNRARNPGLGRFWGLVNPGLGSLIRSGQFDAVVIYTGYVYASFWIGAIATKLAGLPLLFSTDASSLDARQGPAWKVGLKARILPWIFQWADVALATAAAGKQFLLDLGLPPHRVALTPFVVDNDWWSRQANQVDRNVARLAWGIPPEAPVILFCAKLQPWKRPMDVLQALIQAAVPQAYLLFAGEGPLRAELEAAAQAAGVADRVKFLGFVNQSQLPTAYRVADLLVLPSGYDPCPVVVCEAMVCGCPVVLSDEIRGRFDLVLPGKTGFIYPCGDIPALAAILRETLPDPARLQALSLAAQQRMETWSPRDNVNALVQAVEQAIANQSRL